MIAHRNAFAAAFVFASCAIACDKKEEASNNPPPAPPPSAAPQKANACATGGGEVKDSTSAAFFARQAGGYCIDPEGIEKTYGEGGKYSMDEVCTTAFDGECEVYKRFGLKRVVTLRYIDGSGKPNSVEVVLSAFGDPAGAYGMFTKRVVADGDPMAATVKPLEAGGAAAQSSSNAYLWKGSYLAELTFQGEDPNVTKEAMTKESQRVTAAIAKEMGTKLPGTSDKLASAKALPEANRIPLGVDFRPKDALGFAAIGQTAIGFYKEGDQRYRVVAMARPDAEQAKDVIKTLKNKGGAAVKDVGEEAVSIAVQEGKDRPKAEYTFARKGPLVLGIGDEEFGGTKLTKDDKAAKLKTLLTQTAAAPAPAASASSAPSGTAATKK